MRIRASLVFIAACLSLSCDAAPRYRSYPAAADTVEVPASMGTPVLTDGTFSAGEWDDAARMMVNDSITFFFKQQHDHLFFGIRCPELNIPAFDLFLDPGDGAIYQLHISAQLGERTLNTTSEDAEDPAFVWGRTTGWYANEIRWDEGRLQAIVESGAKTRDEAFPDVVFAFEGAEFQIKRSKFDGPSWHMRLEVVWQGSYDDPFVFPPGTDRKDNTGWIMLVLE